MKLRKQNRAGLVLMLALTGVWAAGCPIDGGNSGTASTDGMPSIDGVTEIRFTAGTSVPAQARAVVERTNPTEFNAGEKVYAYVYDTGSPITNGENKEFTAIANGGFRVSETPVLFFPQSGNNVDIYVSHPSIGATFPTSPLTHTVQADQRSLDNYLASDLMYAGKQNVPSSPSPIQLTFFHLLSKVEVGIKAGDGLSDGDLSGATVTIMNTDTSVDFTPAQAVVGNAASAGTLGTTSNPGVITIGNDVSPKADGGFSYNNVVIVPQTLGVGTEFIKVALRDGRELVYLIPGGGMTFAQSTVYTFQITVGLTGLTVSGTITPWGTDSATVVPR